MGGLLDAVAVGGSVASGVYQARGARQAGRSAERAAQMNAAIARYEATQSASRTRRAGRQEMGKARAQFGKSGLEPAGSPLDLMVQNAGEIERRALEEQQAGEFARGLELTRGRTVRREARRSSAAGLLAGATQAAYFGRRFY